MVTWTITMDAVDADAVSFTSSTIISFDIDIDDNDASSATLWTARCPQFLTEAQPQPCPDVALTMRSSTLTSLTMSRTNAHLDDQGALYLVEILPESKYRRKSSYWTATTVQKQVHPRGEGLLVSPLLPYPSLVTLFSDSEILDYAHHRHHHKSSTLHPQSRLYPRVLITTATHMFSLQTSFARTSSLSRLN
jgi:hypothetical protein